MLNRDICVKCWRVHGLPVMDFDNKKLMICPMFFMSLDVRVGDKYIEINDPKSQPPESCSYIVEQTIS